MTEIIHGNTNKNVYKKVRVWGKGQFTIPADIRNRLGIGEDTYLEVFQVGKAIIATPEKIIIKELSNIVRKEMAQNDIVLEQLLSELREGEHEYETD